MSQAFILIFFPLLMAFAAASDLVSMTISNRVSLALIGGFAVAALLAGLSLQEVGWHLAAAGLVLVCTFGMFAAGWIGGGDAKLAAATALWFGFDHLADYLLLSSILGGALTLGLLSLRRYPLPQVVAQWPWAARLHDTKTGIPYGIALAAAALLVYPESRLWLGALAG
jgi:prepilin peptidase CpaA